MGRPWSGWVWRSRWTQATQPATSTWRTHTSRTAITAAACGSFGASWNGALTRPPRHGALSDNADAHRIHGHLIAATGDSAAAETAWRAALRHKPEDVCFIRASRFQTIHQAYKSQSMPRSQKVHNAATPPPTAKTTSVLSVSGSFGQGLGSSRNLCCRATAAACIRIESRSSSQ